jgi:hypothetical protein
MTSAELLRAAADALDGGTDPFSTGWLSEHDVSLDQCLNLAKQLAIGARIVAAGIEKPRSEQGLAMLLTMADSLPH